MDADSLRELATNALTGHWPPHLGVTTDAEKIEYLARALDSVAGKTEEVEAEMQLEIDRLEAASVDTANDITRLESKLERIAAIANDEVA